MIQLHSGRLMSLPALSANKQSHGGSEFGQANMSQSHSFPLAASQRPKPTTICDGLEARLGSLTWPIVRDLVDDVITVSEEEVVAAMQLVMERMKVRAGRRAGRQAGMRAGRQAGRHYRQALHAACIIILADACGGLHACSMRRRAVPCCAAQVVVEPSGAAGVAAALSRQMSRHPELKAVGVILCGGNVDFSARVPGFWQQWLAAPDA